MLPSHELSSLNLHAFQGLPLADPKLGTPDRIDLILAADLYGRLLLGPIVNDATTRLTAQSTALGWIVSGPLDLPPLKDSPVHPPAFSLTSASDPELHDLVLQFWRQEDVGPSIASSLTPDELEAEAHFSRTHARNRDGRYVVRLPMRPTISSLGSFRLLAQDALHRMQRRFSRDPELGRKYEEFLRQYEDLGHMTEVAPLGKGESLLFHLPHHGVLKRNSTTSPLRVVFNGSAHSTSGLSLNECLHVGPKLQTDLADVLLRWRTHRFCFSADVTKMYKQIEVHQSDQDLQRILWSPTGAAREFRLTTVTYGLSCAPFLALRVLQQLATDEGPRFPRAAPIIPREMYVDDVLSGADSITEANLRATELSGLLMAGGFRLHKWSSNDDAVLSGLAEGTSNISTERALSHESLPRALGLAWHPVLLSPLPEPLTKRSALSRAAQLFDPLGLLAPVVIRAKIFLQGLWKIQLSWDEPLPSGLTEQWIALEEDLTAIKTLSVDRWIGTQPGSTIELHGFSDASKDALGAALYARITTPDCTIRTALVVAKSKVAPLMPTTVPRLELSAALLLARLLARVRATLRLDCASVHLWTDSSVVLFWLRGPASRWREFVANRVAAIHELAPEAHWHHVRGIDNPADLASRGIPLRELSARDLWWRGPGWLATPAPSWATEDPPLDAAADLEQKTRTCLATVGPPGPIWELAFQYSTFTRLLRVTAWVRQAAAAFRGKRARVFDSTLSLSEITEAERFWAHATKNSHFSREIATLSSGSPLSRSHSFIRLTPFLDELGLLRVGGRLRNSNLDYDARHPVILPRDAFFSSLVIASAHSITMHGGVQTVLAHIRRSYWILGGRAPVSSYIRRCVRCARFRASPAQELMEQLPAIRVTPSRPFLHSGVDYAGPFVLKTWRGRSARTYESYLVLFVCMATSAVHLELAADYSTAGFLAAYKRFSGRRSICATLSSDCGTNFVGADAELRRLFTAASREAANLASVLASDGTLWRFNPPSAPHFGGKWEAAIKSVKSHLRRVVGDHVLTYEEFSTVLTQVEAILNSRPLCEISDDPSDLEPLLRRTSSLVDRLLSFRNLPSRRRRSIDSRGGNFCAT